MIEHDKHTHTHLGVRPHTQATQKDDRQKTLDGNTFLLFFFFIIPCQRVRYLGFKTRNPNSSF